MADQTVTKYVRIVGQVAGLDEFRKAAEEFNKMNKDLSGMSTGFSNVNGSVKTANQSMAGWNAQLKQQEVAMGLLPQKIAAIRSELSRMSAAGDTGSARFRVLTGELNRLTDAHRKFDSSMHGNVNTLRNNRQQLQNVSYQLTDMVVQLQGGQSIATAVAQQVPQILAGFGAFGAALGLVVSLTAALGGPLLKSLFSAGDGMKDFAKQTELLDDALSEIEKLGKDIDMKGVIDSFNQMDDSTKRLAANLLATRLQLAEIRAEESMDQLKKSVDAAGKSIFGMLGSIQSVYAFMQVSKNMGLDDLSTLEVTKVFQDLNSGAITAAVAMEKLRQVNAKGNEAFRKLRKEIADAADDEARRALVLKATLKLQEDMNKSLATGAKIESPLTKKELADAAKKLKDAEEERTKTIGTLALEYYKLLGPLTEYQELLYREQLGLEKIDPLIREHIVALTKMKDEQKALNDLKKYEVEALKAEADLLAREDKQREAALRKRKEEQQSLIDSYDTTGASLRKLAADSQRLREMFAEGIIDDEEFSAAMAGLQKAVDATFSDQNKKKIDDFEKAMQELAVDGFGDLIDVIFEADQSFKEFAGNFLREMAKMIAKTAIFGALRNTPLGGLLGLPGSAMGNQFGHGTSLSQGVYTQPQLFKFANGSAFGSNVGLMAEAGPEAVMPLKRLPSGKLGVESTVNVNVTNNAGAHVEVEQDGSNINITIERVRRALTRDIQAGGNMFTSAMQQTYGLNRAAR